MGQFSTFRPTPLPCRPYLRLSRQPSLSPAPAHWQGGPMRQPHIPPAHALLSVDDIWALVVGLTPPAYVRVPDRRLGGSHPVGTHPHTLGHRLMGPSRQLPLPHLGRKLIIEHRISVRQLWGLSQSSHSPLLGLGPFRCIKARARDLLRPWTESSNHHRAAEIEGSEAAVVVPYIHLHSESVEGSGKAASVRGLCSGKTSGAKAISV